MGRRRRAARAADRISSLPDGVLSRILSLIPTKEAVATSILSKRWIHLWKSVDSINFSDVKVNDVVSNYKFNEFMYSVLASRDTAGSNFINSFGLDIAYLDPELASLAFPNITKWINLVVQRRLKHLSLQIHMCIFGYKDDDEEDSQFKLPISIFTCKTLVSLDLCRFHVEGFCFSSIEFGFPSLKTLHLMGICFHEDRDFMLLLAGCPNLEHLKASDIDIQDSRTNSPAIHQEFKSLSLPKLTRADITQECECYFPVNALSNSEYLCIDTLKLYTQGLEFYEVNKPQHPYDDIPIFHNLTHLELYDNWYLVARVLQHCPMLQHLKLYEDSCEEIENQENWVDLESVPECLLSSLRTCTIRGFSGLQSELVLAKYILENANYLQTMIIWSESKPSKIQRKLSSCLKASATCQLSVYIDDNM